MDPPSGGKLLQLSVINGGELFRLKVENQSVFVTVRLLMEETAFTNVVGQWLIKSVGLDSKIRHVFWGTKKAQKTESG